MSTAAEIRQHIETIEEAYEFMLAYAAQGRADEGAGPDGAHIRIFLAQFETAIDAIDAGLGDLQCVYSEAAAFLEGMRRDSQTMASVIKIMLARDNVSSEIVDNANGLISVRSYLTSLFFLDKAVLPPQ